MEPKDRDYDFKVEARPIALFETPVAYGKLNGGEDLLLDLEKSIREKMATEKGVRRSNVGGWHSESDMTAWGGTAAGRLADTAINVAKRMSHFLESSSSDYDWVVKMWANVTPQGGLNEAHVHPGNLWAAVLYIDLGGDEGERSKLGAENSDCGGEFFVEDPRFPMNTMRNTAFRLLGVDGRPQQLQSSFNLQRGSLLVFPAWLRHGVRTYTGTRERITIAMNIDARQKA